MSTSLFTIRTSPIPLVSASDARTAGLRPFSDPTLLRVRKGVYAPKREWNALAPWDRYLARVYAYALVAPDVIFALESAAAIQGLPLFGEPRYIHVYNPDRLKSIRYGDVAVHTSCDRRAIERIDSLGVNTTSVAGTVVDLARVLPPAQALAVVDAAISARSPRSCELSELVALASNQSARRGRVQLEWLWDRGDGNAESVGESISRAAIEWCGFEEPELQREFRFEGATDRTDFFWARLGIAGESDGYGKYDAEDVETAKAHFVREKVREDRLRRHLQGFARWDLKDAEHGAPLRRKLQLAGVPIVRPANLAMLATLRRNPRSLART
ncbi:hypothetical protein ACWPKO_19135 (plasmid) [Coraliomargarita sp. W4R53]